MIAVLAIFTLSIAQEIIDLWWSVPMAALIFIIIYFLINPEKIEKWSSIFARLFASISKKSEKHSVSADIQSRISSYVKNNNLHEIMPYGLKFKWVVGENASSYLQGEDIVIVMDYHNNNAKNFLIAIQEWTSKTLLPNIRNDIPSPILKAVELLMQEKIINSQRPDAMEFFKKEILPIKIIEEVKIKKIREQFDFLDQSGYFENVFLQELTFAGPRLQGMQEMQKYVEINGLLNLLEWLLKRESDDESRPLYYSGDVFRIWFILVAKQIKVMRGDPSPYIKRAREAISKKFDSIYVGGREKNMKFTQEVIDEIKSNEIATLKWTKEFKTRDRQHKKKDAKMALFRN
ncbi:MAG: hypothetical protein HW410_1547 [Nitrosarchaeum sp.]|nr:hypothetical protein [Nitrosarchaeum sp.]